MKYHPSYRGFDEYVGLPYSNDMGCLDAVPTTGWNWGNGDIHPGACGTDAGGVGAAAAGDGDGMLHVGGLYGDAPPNGAANAVPLYNSTKPQCAGRSASGDCNADIVEQPVKLQTLSSRYKDEAVKFVHQHAVGSNANPFFLYMPFAHMHVPHGFAPSFVNSSARKNIYGDTLRELDHAVGAVVDAVRTAGIEDHTIIVYTAEYVLRPL